MGDPVEGDATVAGDPCMGDSVEGDATVADLAPPIPGSSGSLSAQDIAATVFNLVWDAATDDRSPPNSLQYRVVRSDAPNIASLADALSQGVVVLDWTAAIDSVAVDDLDPDTTYYVNVVVEDEAGNRAAYTMASAVTPAIDLTPPVVGDSGRLRMAPTAPGTILLSWMQATDDLSQPSALAYQVYRSSSPNITSVAEMQANGTLTGSEQIGVVDLSVTGLSAGTVMYLNVLVRDEVGRASGYGMVSAVGDEEILAVAGGTMTLGWAGVATPTHEVTVSEFYLARYEVTYELWNEVHTWAVGNGYQFNNAGVMGQCGTTTPQHPVVEIDWYDAVVWANAYSEKAGLVPCYYTDATHTLPYRDATLELGLDATWVAWDANGFRLPTNAEWEVAARAAGTRAGDEYAGDADSNSVAWHWGNSGSCTHAVGLKNPSEIGAYDMSGNVWEWCWDWWADYEDASPFTDPDSTGPASGTSRVNRSGSWFDLETFSRVASRWPDPPTTSVASLGLRVVRRP